MFSEGAGDDKCAVLTLEDVTAATGLSAEAIEQREVSGCLYSWDDGTVWMSSVRVHESVHRAKAYYARFTEDATADEVAAATEQVKDEISERETSGEITSTEGAAGRTLANGPILGQDRRRRLDRPGARRGVRTTQRCQPRADVATKNLVAG
ncbi:MAG: hypothetical protein ACODAA_00295 [Gemmatimonadota bacterium]